MRQDARMLAAPLGRPVGLGEAWEVLGTWSGEVEGGPGELHVRVARRRGHAVPCPGCGVPCGAHDARERTWRHPGVWQSGTHARRAVPRTDRPGHGAGTVPVPWEVRPNPHLAALLGDRALAARARGRAAGAADGAPVGGDRGPRDMLGRAVAQARGSADHPGAGRAGHRRDQPPGGHAHTPAMPGPGGGRCARRGRRRRLGTAPRMCGRTRGPRRRQGGDRRGPPVTCRAPSPPASPRRCRRRRRPQAASTSRGSSRGRRIAPGAASAGSPTRGARRPGAPSACG